MPRARRNQSKKNKRDFEALTWLAGLGGFLLYYLLTIGHGYVHPLHWVFAAIGAAVGMGAFKLWQMGTVGSANSDAVAAKMGRPLAIGLLVLAAIVFLAVAYS